jgi:hypothetical protein
MRREDGSEVLLTFATPLPLDVFAELLQGVGEAAKRAGYAEVNLLTDGSMRVVARRVDQVGGA